MRILIAEDDHYMGQALTLALTKQNYAVDIVPDGETAWDCINTYPYDLMILDVLLPKLDGISLCQRIRWAKRGTPVLLLTGQGSGSAKVLGLDAGADDYVVKPFDVEELLARVRVLLRRSSIPPLMELSWEKLSLNPGTCEARYAEHSLHLTPKEFRLLELFLRNPGRVFSRENILTHLWSSVDAPSEATVATHLTGLRNKLRAVGSPEDMIETVYGIGYRLREGEVVRQSQQASSRS